MNYRIWVSYHKDEQIALFDLKSDEHHVLYPTHRNVEGRSINELNPVYSEMVTMWHVWQNDVKSDVVGFEHYRRHLHVTTVPRKGECQVLSVRRFEDQTLYEQYAQWHNRRDMDLMLDILDERYGKDNAYGRHIREGHTLIANCTFLMRWTDFVKMCEYLFPLLEEFGRRCGMTDGLGTLGEWTEKAVRDFDGRKTTYQRRVVSFLAERLISAWIDLHLQWYNGITVAAVGTEQVKDGIPLLQPFLCWLNVPMLREHGIRYFDGQHMWALTPGNRWDTGAWLLHQIRKLRLRWRAVDIWEYVIHFGHGSWRERDAQGWLNQNKELWI